MAIPAAVPRAADRDIIVIGASAGGIEALKVLVKGLPPDLPAALFIVQHLAPHATSWLPRILTRAGPWPAAHPHNGEPITSGRIYVAPPDYHLTLASGHVHLSRGPKEHGVRPAIDPLFRSAASTYGPRVVGVILTGMLDDGTAGLIAVKVGGGVTVVQDPQDALFPAMPRSALRYLEVDYCLPLAEVPSVLARLTQRPLATGEGEIIYSTSDRTTALTQEQIAAVERDAVTDCPAAISCPDCGGIIWRVQEGALTQFCCRMGHRYTLESLLVQHSEALERVLCMARRMLEERVSSGRELASLARHSLDQASGEAWEQAAQEAERHAGLVRQILTGRARPDDSEPGAVDQ
jgi:two-component system, chemotaxis family, protein-glutamate methylesterase/glutaminase